MSSSIKSLIESGTKLWLDSIDPVLVKENRAIGATGATSNPIIIADLLKTGRFDDQIQQLVFEGMNNEGIAWEMTDRLVAEAQSVFETVWQSTNGNDGYVSFELDPLLEDESCELSHDEKVAKYIELGIQWSAPHKNRMIKVPATAAGLDSVEELAAAGVPLNVTLIFTKNQYIAARDAVWRGAQRLDNLEKFKSVYSIFVSRIDVYTEKHVSQLSSQSQGQVGIVNAKSIWATNREFWGSRDCPLDQEIIFASTGTKKPEDSPDKYVEALAGSDIQTNPPATNDAVEALGKTYSKQVDQLPPQPVLDEIEREVDPQALEDQLMMEGTAKFADPHKALLQLIAEKRAALVAG